MNKLPSPQTEIIIAIILLLLLGIIFNPFDMYMTKMTTMLIALGFVLLFGMFALFVLRESPRDEREELLTEKSGRVAFLITGLVVTVGIMYQTLTHTVDHWLLAVFAAMILSKLVSYIYIDNKS